MNENEELQSGFPDWLTKDYKLMEPVFCRSFLREHPMRCIRGRFYTVDGLVADESGLKKEIYDQISPWLESKIARKVDELLNALPKTNYIKSIVTSECKMDMERKGVQSYQSQLYVRFLCFGNGALTALHDRSDGFFRRQIVLTTKDKPAGRADDPFLSDKLIAEREGIFLWCLEGLHRLLVNNYRFTISDRARENISVVVREANNIVDFLASAGYVQFKADSEAATRDLYAAYKVWCEDNAENPLSPKSFSGFIAQNADVYQLEATNNVYIGSGKRCRGYLGIEVFIKPTAL